MPHEFKPTNTDTLARLDLKRDFVQHTRTICRVASGKLLYTKASTGGPVSRGDTIAGGFLLLLDRDVLLNTFQAADLVRIKI